MQLKEKCKTCDGCGGVEKICAVCNGSGEGRREESQCGICKGLGTEVVLCEQCGGTGDSDDYEDDC